MAKGVYTSGDPEKNFLGEILGIFLRLALAPEESNHSGGVELVEAAEVLLPLDPRLNLEDEPAALVFFGAPRRRATARRITSPVSGFHGSGVGWREDRAAV
jgi:hypothetical protein